jgi:hypothetical protein
LSADFGVTIGATGDSWRQDGGFSSMDESHGLNAQHSFAM